MPKIDACITLAVRLSIQVGGHEGTYPAWWRQMAIQINGIFSALGLLLLDGQATAFTDSQATAFTLDGHTLTVAANDSGSGFYIVIP